MFVKWGNTILLVRLLRYIMHMFNPSVNPPFQILHVAIDHVERGKAPSLTALVCLKDFRRLQFEFQTPEDCVDMMDALEALSKPGEWWCWHLSSWSHYSLSYRYAV